MKNLKLLARPTLELGCALSLLGCQSLETSVPNEGDTSHHSESLPAITDKTAGLRPLPGFMDCFVDDDEGRIWLVVPDERTAPGDPVLSSCLYVEGLTTGLGSNPVGLDRGQLGATRVVEFRRFGRRLFLCQPNLGFRALSDDADEARATTDSFATSTLWAGSIAAEDPGERVLVDITSLLVADAHGTAATLQRTGQGAWRLDSERSGLDTTASLAFPDNLEFEALLTFASDSPGAEVRATVPTSKSLSLVQHHSFVRLPDSGYTPRAFDPRMGHFGERFLDYAAPLSASLEVHLAARHRLLHREPGRSGSPAVEPIVYYVDRGAPEPIRGALLEGASWWSQAFTSAGFPGAFRVELLPEGAHPMDVRYNVIQWVHRSTRGWSYGGGVRDPRTGELIKGHVSLGSLRVRQDRLLFEGLVGTAATGSGAADDPIELSLARIRQLAAHEVGHTLGLAHNFSASTYAGRASVMDYPAPLVHVRASGALDLSEVYGVGVGVWDELAIRYLYSEFTPGADEATELEKLAQEAYAKGYRYHSDSDARAPGAAIPLANLWDNGSDPVTGLEEVLAVRHAALARFGEHNLAAGRPSGELEEVLAPLYFYHRYQVEAAIKTLGGVDVTHRLVGDGGPAMLAVPAAEQRRALATVLGALAPAALDLPEEVLRLLVPHQPGDAGSDERFRGRSAPLFDPLAAAETAAQLVVDGLLQRERCARLVDQARRDAEQLGLEELLDQICLAVLPSSPLEDPREAELRFVTQSVVFDGLLALAQDPSASAAVRERVEARLRLLANDELPLRVISAPAHYENWIATLQRYLTRSRDDTAAPSPPKAAPPGSPIGSRDLGRCSFDAAVPYAW